MPRQRVRVDRGLHAGFEALAEPDHPREGLLGQDLLSVARIAASESTFAASVPPTPPTSDSSCGIAASMRSATSSVNPYAAHAIPPPIALPIVSTSGSRACAPVYPPGPAQWCASRR